MFIDKQILSSRIEIDEIVEETSKSFDYSFDGLSVTELPEIKNIPDSFQIGLIVGPSGSGKSSVLSKFGKEEEIVWNQNKAVVSHFQNTDEALKQLYAVGLNSIPSIIRPYQVLSTGEKHRADMSRRIKSNTVIDEFTSVVDRNVAKSMSNALNRFVAQENLQNIVIATCHYDIIEWLRPDWVLDTATWSLSTERRLRRPKINLRLIPCRRQAWEIFSKHHYLSGDLNKSAMTWIVTWDDVLVGFGASIPFPHLKYPKAYRAHRVVVLPDFQGLGIGVKISDMMAETLIRTEKADNFFGKTSHPRLGGYREKSPLWKPTAHNLSMREDYNADNRDKKFSIKLKEIHANRLCYCHEYVGAKEIVEKRNSEKKTILDFI